MEIDTCLRPEVTGTVDSRAMRAQYLDTLDLERERGITIKSVPVRMNYKAPDGSDFILNLIDTPGHVDFSYEVSRSLAACEGALLVVDAAQGVEAQTVANAYMASEQGLELVPVINKIDLPSAQPEEAKRELEEIIGVDAHDAILASAKEGRGIQEILDRIVRDIPAPKGDPEAPLQALIFDLVYDNYRGVICYVRIVNGKLKAGQSVRFMATGEKCPAEEVGAFQAGHDHGPGTRGRGGRVPCRQHQDNPRGACGGHGD